MPKVSIVIPGYNHASFLKQRIDSVLGQTFQDIEVILLDDYSTDNSRQIIEEYRNHPKIKHLICNESNSASTFKQWKKGIELCDAEIIWIAESDDCSDKNFLSVLFPIIEQDERLGIVYCQSLKVDDKNNVTGNWKNHTDDLNRLKFERDFTMPGPSYIEHFLIHKNTIPNASAVIFRKKYYEMSGGAETEIKYCGDWITWLKMLLFSNIFFLSEPLNYFRYHNNSVIAMATRNCDHSLYVEKYDRTMRKKFQEYLEEKHIEKTNLLKLNYNYILKENSAEELFELNNK